MWGDFDSRLANRVSSCGSSGGVSSWNDLTDKPFGEETGVVEVLAECQPTYADGMFMVNTPVSVSVGETYIVNINGVEYECVANALTIGESTGVSLGDASMMGGIGNNEPFTVIVFPPEGVAAMGFYAHIAVKDETVTELTVSIYHDTTVIHPIDPKFLPEHLQFGKEWVDGECEEYIFICTELTDGEYDEEYDGYVWNGNGLLGDIPIHAGATYRLEIGEVNFYGVAQNENEIGYYPFEDVCQFYLNKSEDILVLSVDGEGNEASPYDSRLFYAGNTVKTIDEKYLPKASAVDDAMEETVTAEEFNALLASLRDAGYLAT